MTQHVTERERIYRHGSVAKNKIRPERTGPNKRERDNMRKNDTEQEKRRNQKEQYKTRQEGTT